MKILNFERFKDGWTTEITTDEGVFTIDERLGTKTRGGLYLGYPNKDNSNIINDSKEMEEKIIEALKNYKNEFYQASIECFIKEKTKK